MNTNEQLVLMMQMIYRVLSFILFHIKSSTTLKVLAILCEMISNLLSGRINFEEYRQELQQLFKREYDYENWMDSIFNERIPDSEISKLKDINNYLPVILRSLKETMKYIGGGDFERAYDLLDMLHCLPDAILNKNWDERAYWKTYVNTYRKKWDKNYLRDIEKTIRKHK